jgi:hypothetical protein
MNDHHIFGSLDFAVKFVDMTACFADVVGIVVGMLEAVKGKRVPC